MVTVTEKATLIEDLAAVERLAGATRFCEAVTESVHRRAAAEQAWRQLVGLLATMSVALVIVLFVSCFCGPLSGFVSSFMSDGSVFASYGVASSPTSKFFSWKEFVQIIIMAAPLLALYLLPIIGVMTFACLDSSEILILIEGAGDEKSPEKVS